MPLLLGLSVAEVNERICGVLPQIHPWGSVVELPKTHVKKNWHQLWPWWQINTAAPAKLVSILVKLGLTLGVAESATGGLVCSMITDIPGSSSVLAGGIVTYTNRIKQSLLELEEVPDSGVEAQLTLAMANQVRQVLSVDIGLAVTGVLGPSIPGDGLKVGQIYGAISSPWFSGVFFTNLPEAAG